MSAPVATYDYVADGTLIFQKLRYEPKSFSLRRPNGRGWITKDVWQGIDLPLFRQDEVMAHGAEPVYIFEGEKDVLSAVTLGLVTATTNPEGASRWEAKYSERLRGRDVVVTADADPAGRNHAHDAASSISTTAQSVKLVYLPGDCDLAEWVERGGTAEQFADLVAAAPLYTPTAGLLEEVRTYIGRYVIFPDRRFLDVMALWTLHTHAIGAFDTTPRLLLRSAEKESGKTRTLEVLDLLVAAPLSVMNATPAAIFRTLADGPVTIEFDEVDAVFGPKAAREHEDLRALLNAGYRRGAQVIRVVGDGKKMHVERFPVFAPTALAAIGNLPDTVESRSIVIPMRRRRPDEVVESFRLRDASAASAWLRDRLSAWSVEAESALSESRPLMPDGVADRSADCWEPLLAIADLAGSDWPARAREAARFVVAGRVADDLSLGVRLLSDIKAVIGDTDRMSSATLAAKLNAIEESGWGGWHDGKGITPRDIAHRLRAYGITPKTIRVGVETPKGYERDSFADAWARYLRDPVPIRNKRNEGNAYSDQVADVAAVADTYTGPDLCPQCGGSDLDGDGAWWWCSTCNERGRI